MAEAESTRLESFAIPQRSNSFQRLVYLIHRTLSPAWDVSESVELLDRQTGKKREVDIVVRGPVGPHPFVIGIECVARKRKADIEWVEQQAKKHETLTDKLILVSERGFYRDAAVKAKLLGIQTYTLGGLLNGLVTAGRESITVAWTRLDKVVDCEFKVRGPSIEVDGHSMIIAANGTPIGSVNSIMREHVLDKGLIEELGKRGGTEVEVSCTFPRGSWIENGQGERAAIEGLVARSKVITAEKTILGTSGEFAGHPILHGVVEDCNPPLLVVFVTDAEGKTTMVFDPPNVSPPPGAVTGKF